ncbi:ABC transporter ATP-binding protein [Salisediminibacterium halotolerans]|uniref:Carnitine transport ATP-binding protein OpuCA n=1 Tax=Salisediminibacterium halotolerans TaxID=517425 RepID=A0A1H9UE07_9BACI|nr:ABC transporter ATP-binding protein [Salisediminibacterium haloalkalitolerans]SES07790.1 iron(III) transport system ATP-binding protein/putative spermidine/putrescine transport system ATP-binding protein [Salisediminibacterium haloalkalitolerans]
MLMELKNASKSFRDTEIFHDLNLQITEGSVMSLVGPSGCGKSTLLRAVAGLTALSSGQILIENEDITTVKAEKRPVVMMFQDPLLFPHLTILENVTYGLKYGRNKVNKTERIKRGRELLEKVELESYENRYPNQLSGGQKQRVSLARALILNPSVILLDEPFSSLDPELRNSIRTWVRSFLKRENVTALFVTHDREEAMILGDRIAIMKNGTFCQVGSPEDIYHHPKTDEVADMFSEGIIYKGEFISSGRLKIKTADEPASEDTALGAVINYRIYKYGLPFYAVTIEVSGQEVMIHSDQAWEREDEVMIVFRPEATNELTAVESEK